MIKQDSDFIFHPRYGLSKLQFILVYIWNTEVGRLTREITASEK